MYNEDVYSNTEFVDEDFVDDVFDEEDDNFEDNHTLWQDMDDFPCEIIETVPTTSNIENVEFRLAENGNLRVKSKYDIFAESFYFEPMQMYDGQLYDRFISSTEQIIRTSMEYRAYLAYLKNEIGLIYDAFNGNISHDEATLEFHHGPIFTLYDYVKIMIDYAFDNQIPVTTFTIARMVMNEHACNRVQGVMLTKNNHKLVHAGKLNVDLRQCHGNIKEFIRLYGKYIRHSPKLMRKMNNYRVQIESGDFYNTEMITPDKLIDWSIEKPYEG